MVIGSQVTFVKSFPNFFPFQNSYKQPGDAEVVWIAPVLSIFQAAAAHHFTGSFLGISQAAHSQSVATSEGAC